MEVSSWSGSPPYGCGEFEKLRAEAQPGALRGIQIDLETNPVTIQNKLNHAAASGESCHIAYGEHIRCSERGQYRRQLRLFGRTNKQDAAARGFFYARQPLCSHRCAANGFPFQRPIEHGAEWVLSEDANVEQIGRA